MKKKLALLLVLVIVVSLTACGAEEHAVEKDPTPADPPTEKNEHVSGEEPENVTIEAWIVQSDWNDAWDTMEERFEQQYPWIDVESVGVGEEGTNFISVRNAANDLPDIVQIDNNEFWQAIVDEGKIADLRGRDVCQYIPQSYLNTFTYNDTLIGITQGAAFSVMYFNMQILNEAGWESPPTNWEQFLQCCADVQAAGYAPLALSGTYNVGLWMLFELIIANTVGEELGQGVYDEQFKNGTFDFTSYPELVTKLEALQPYVLTGSASMSQDDLITVMADGSAAMCLGGNWVARSILDCITTVTDDEALAVATLPPFQSEGSTSWISVSPETGFGITVNENRSESEQKAVELFFDWLFLPENFMLIQNARGTVPVLGSMTEEHIVLPSSIAAILNDMTAAPYVTMGFNLYTAEFIDTVGTALRDCISGNATAQDVVNLMWQTEQTSYFNQ